MNQRRYLVDTAFVMSLLNRADQYHNRARLWLPHMQAAGELWITEAILVEIGNAFSASNRAAAAQFIRQIYQTPNFKVVNIDKPLLLRALELYEKHSDKRWGLTDCISFIVMSENGIHEARTPDHHFEQAGFIPLLKVDPE